MAVEIWPGVLWQLTTKLWIDDFGLSTAKWPIDNWINAALSIHQFDTKHPLDISTHVGQS